MRLLIVTQKVDSTDPILGFFHRWIAEFAAHCAHVHVIGQKVGKHNLPSNVTVHSLGKEDRAWRIVQVLRYRWLLFRLRKEYDAIFVHMTPIWVVLAWAESVFFRKQIYLWYEARGVHWQIKLALNIVHKVFSASTFGMPIATPKSVITGHGIDTEVFAPGREHRDARLLITIGRITASKRLPIIIDALQHVSDARLFIAGTVITSADRQYQAEMQKLLSDRHLAGRVHMHPLSQEEVVAALQRAQLFLHASATSLDKALLEAMACGCIVVSCSDAARDVLPQICRTTPHEMGERVKTLLALSEEEKAKIRSDLRGTILQHHSLEKLIQKLVTEMS